MSSSVNISDDSAERLKRAGESRVRSLGSIANFMRRGSMGISNVSHFTQRRQSSAINGPQWSFIASTIGDVSMREQPVSMVNLPRGPVDLISGSRYEGMWDSLGMSGRGVYTMPHGVQYTGDLYDNCFKGSGYLQYSNGAKIKVVYSKAWNENLNDSAYRVTEVSYIFKDELPYSADDWEYCSINDRRFHVETQEGMQPVCTERRTQRQPTPTLPPGCYDTGEGVYNPSTWCLTDHDTGAIISIPTPEERRWIMKNCLTSNVVSVGYRPDLYENWAETATEVTMETEDSSEAESVDQRPYDFGTDVSSAAVSPTVGDSSKTSVTTGQFSFHGT